MYTPGPIPADVDDATASFLQQELQRISQAFLVDEHELLELTPLEREPNIDAERDGFLAFADGTSWNPGSGRGIYVRDGGVWNLLLSL